MFVVNHRKIILTILAVLVIAAFVVVGVFGLKPSIDFTGGTFLELTYKGTPPTASEIETKLAPLNLGKIELQTVGDHSLVVRAKTLTEDEHNGLLAIVGALPANDLVKEEQYSSIGPSIGSELKRKAAWGVALVIIFIILYIVFAFRKVGRIVPGWLYAAVTFITFIHDMMIPVGVFALLGHFYHVQVDALFITALLAILGYSINDTIIVLDRVRENLYRATPKEQETDFAGIVGRSLRQTAVRSINTSFTVILVLLALIFVGSPATKWFALTLAIGAAAGTYSSIFLASPLLVILQGLRKAKK